jgi:ATP-binding cassette subfamily F protein uup
VAGLPRKATLAERRELAGMEAAILAAEEEVAALEARLNDPEFQTSSFAEVPAAVARLEEARAEAARLYQRWEELETICDGGS